MGRFGKCPYCDRATGSKAELHLDRCRKRAIKALRGRQAAKLVAFFAQVAPPKKAESWTDGDSDDDEVAA